MMRHLGRETRIAEVVRGERAAGRQVEVVPAGADKTESLRLFAEVLGFPSYFGHNLDALADSLTDHVGGRIRCLRISSWPPGSAWAAGWWAGP